MHLRFEALGVVAEVDVGGNEPPAPPRDAVHDNLHIFFTASKAQLLFDIIYDLLGAVKRKPMMPAHAVVLLVFIVEILLAYFAAQVAINVFVFGATDDARIERTP